jgi:hypothetical protein
VAAIDTALVLKAVEPIWRRAQTTGDRTRQRIEVVLDWATARGARSGDNPARWNGHLEHLLRGNHKVKHHEAPRSKFSLVNRMIPNLSSLRLGPAGQWSVTRWPM